MGNDFVGVAWPLLASLEWYGEHVLRDISLEKIVKVTKVGSHAFLDLL